MKEGQFSQHSGDGVCPQSGVERKGTFVRAAERPAKTKLVNQDAGTLGVT